ncbi:MAG: hypothetical protein SFY92_05180 [Verrucomicrobiae bacterium]|nr:hypothetical protein [Verrucomicrobiae bacterium]
MKKLFLLIILLAAGWYGWKFLNEKVDLDKATENQRQDMDRQVQREVQNPRPAPQNAQIPAESNSGQGSASSRTAESLRNMAVPVPVSPEHGENKK